MAIPGPLLRLAPVPTVMTSGSGGIGTTYGFIVPSSVQSGDSLVATVDHAPVYGSFAAAGWTNIGGNTYWKVATSGDAGSAISLDTAVVAGVLLVYKNAATTQPLFSAGTSPTAPAITTTQPKSTVTEVWLMNSTTAGFGPPFPTVTPPATNEAALGPFNMLGFGVGGFYMVGVSDQTQAVPGLAAAETATGTGTGLTWATVSLVVFPALVPAAPILNTPPDTSYAHLSGTPTFSWIYQPTTGDGTQEAWAFRRKTSGAYSYWDATALNFSSSTPVWNAGSITSYTFPAAAWSDGVTYHWSVATEESAYDGQGPFATDFTVNGLTAPTVTVIAPAGTVIIPDPTVTWTDTVSGGTVEATYRAVLYTAAQYGASGFNPGVTPGVYDTGPLAPYANTTVVPAGVLSNGTYRAYVQITETFGVASAWAYKQFILMIEEPHEPVLTGTVTTDPMTTLPVVQLAFQGEDNLLTEIDAAIDLTGVGSWVGTNAALSQSTGP